jgi:hypothetical protein
MSGGHLLAAGLDGGNTIMKSNPSSFAKHYFSIFISSSIVAQSDATALVFSRTGRRMPLSCYLKRSQKECTINAVPG